MHLERIASIAKNIAIQAERRAIETLHVPQILALVKEAELLSRLKQNGTDAAELKTTHRIPPGKKAQQQQLHFKRITRKRQKQKSKGILR